MNKWVYFIWFLLLAIGAGAKYYFGKDPAIPSRGKFIITRDLLVNEQLQKGDVVLSIHKGEDTPAYNLDTFYGQHLRIRKNKNDSIILSEVDHVPGLNFFAGRSFTIINLQNEEMILTQMIKANSFIGLCATLLEEKSLQTQCLDSVLVLAVHRSDSLNSQSYLLVQPPENSENEMGRFLSLKNRYFFISAPGK